VATRSLSDTHACFHHKRWRCAPARSTGQFINFSSFFKGQYAYNGYLYWNPTFEGLGEGKYRVAMYFADGTEKARYAQGLGLNFQKQLHDDWTVFFKYNRADKRVPDIRQSAAVGVIWMNPSNATAGNMAGVLPLRLKAAF
jgi:hypothetical protein